MCSALEVREGADLLASAAEVAAAVAAVVSPGLCRFAATCHGQPWHRQEVFLLISGYLRSMFLCFKRVTRSNTCDVSGSKVCIYTKAHVPRSVPLTYKRLLHLSTQG